MTRFEIVVRAVLVASVLGIVILSGVPFLWRLFQQGARRRFEAVLRADLAKAYRERTRKWCPVCNVRSFTAETVCPVCIVDLIPMREIDAFELPLPRAFMARDRQRDPVVMRDQMHADRHTKLRILQRRRPA